ncbi:MAG TPA: hypothetical protein VGU71_04155 [Candidatus Dormibacteraeota bacterium]|nr:hypothetical protein [Candidatus Dormibacteraeota bacterium]
MPTRELTDPNFYKVRLVLAGGVVLHLISRREPSVTVAADGHVEGVDADWVVGPDVDAGDTIGYVDWPRVIAVTWRRDAAA